MVLGQMLSERISNSGDKERKSQGHLMFDDPKAAKLTALILVSLKGKLKNREADTCPGLWRKQYRCSADKRKQ